MSYQRKHQNVLVMFMMKSVVTYIVLMELLDRMMQQVANVVNAKIHVVIILARVTKNVLLIFNHMHNMVHNLYQYVEISINQEDVLKLVMILDVKMSKV